MSVHTLWFISALLSVVDSSKRNINQMRHTNTLDKESDNGLAIAGREDNKSSIKGGFVFLIVLTTRFCFRGLTLYTLAHA